MKKLQRGCWFAVLAAGILGPGIQPAFAATPAIYNVTNNSADVATPGSLPWCVSQANMSAGPDIIRFVTGNSITVHANLTITDQVDIRGNSNSVGAHDGTGANRTTCFSFASGSDGSTITGLALVDSTSGVSLLSNGNWVANCRVGLDWAGTARGNIWGIYDQGQNNRIGGGPGEGNIVADNATTGIYLVNSYRSRIQGNTVGTNPAGTAALGVQAVGIYLDAAVQTLIGGDRGLGLGNLVSGNTAYGLLLENATCFGNTLCGNVVGLNVGETSAVPNQGDGIRLQEAQGNFIGLPVAGYENVVAGNLQNNVILFQGSSTPTRVRHTTIQNNFIGVNGSSADGFVSNAYSLYLNGADGNLIGGDRNTLERNVVSGNTQGGYGIYVIGHGNTVCGNYIGTNDGGTAARPNTAGLTVNGSGNLIGGDNQGAIFLGNVVSGNASSGISVNTGSGNTIAGNYVGLSGDGLSALGNLDRGIVLMSSAGPTLIGGTGASARNVVSANAWEGIYLMSAAHHQVIGNYLGLNALGTATLANGNNTGIALNGAGYNLISGNVLARSIHTWGAGVCGNTITANRIGLRPDGAATGATLGVSFALDAHGNFCGQPAGQGNLISQVNVGVSVSGAATLGNAIWGNTITACSNTAIELLGGGNGAKAAPVITGANSAGTIDGTALAGDYVEVFVAEGAGGNGGSVRYLGYAAADGGGNWSLNSGGLVTAGEYVCATATDNGNNTSGFSANVLVAGPPPTYTPTISPTVTLTPVLTPTPTSTPSPALTPTFTCTPTVDLGSLDLGGRQVLAFPNPAREQMNFVFTLEQPAEVILEIYNLAGERIATLRQNTPAGRGQTLVWDCRETAPGIYLGRLLVGGAEKATCKIAVVR